MDLWICGNMDMCNLSICEFVNYCLEDATYAKLTRPKKNELVVALDKLNASMMMLLLVICSSQKYWAKYNLWRNI